MKVRSSLTALYSFFFVTVWLPEIVADIHAWRPTYRGLVTRGRSWQHRGTRGSETWTLTVLTGGDNLIGLQHEKTYLLTCAPKLNCIRAVFVVRMKTLHNFGYPNCTQWRFGSDCANAQSDLNLRLAWRTCLKIGFLALRLIFFASYRNLKYSRLLEGFV